MRVLVTWGSKRGGTEGLARTLGAALLTEGLEVAMVPAADADRIHDFDAVIVGGALYANRWHRDARRFVRRHEKQLRTVPVWFFSSGPLDASAHDQRIPPTEQVQVLMERVGAQGHMTFGGRLTPDAKGFPASAMAKTHAGDWRNVDDVRHWALQLAAALPTARPGHVVPQPAHSIARLVVHAVAGWAVCASIAGAIAWAISPEVAVVVQALLIPFVFAGIARSYFDVHGARAPLPTAITFAGVFAVLDLAVIGGFVERSVATITSFGRLWLPVALVFAVSWAAGAVLSMRPFPKQEPHKP